MSTIKKVEFKDNGLRKSSGKELKKFGQQQFKFVQNHKSMMNKTTKIKIRFGGTIQEI